MARPRSFRESAVLDIALGLFWSRGYQNVSIGDLTEASGVARQSLYNAFGNKRSMFVRVLAHYRATQLAPVLEVLRADGSPRQNVSKAFTAFRTLAADNANRGCLVANTLVEVAPHDAEIAEMLQQTLTELEDAFVDALRRAREAGEIPAAKQPRPLARALVNAIMGLACSGRLALKPRHVADIYNGTLAILD